MTKGFQVRATCPKGLEGLLAQELESLGFASVSESVAGVNGQGGLVEIYRACLWSRLANRILMTFGVFPVTDAESLYLAMLSVPWTKHFSSKSSFAVDFSGTNSSIKHTGFGAQKVKDAIVDHFRQRSGDRPSVDRQNPEIRLNARLARSGLTLALDMSGDSLHRRYYRGKGVPAPLKENLAAALLIRSGWPQMAEDGRPLLDPMCGSGTLLIEAAMMAADMAPALLRPRFGFESWLGHRPELWQPLLREAEERQRRGLTGNLPEIRGYDASKQAVEAAQSNIETAGLASWVKVICKPLAAFKKPTHIALPPGLIIANPPYGERLGEIENLHLLYRLLGEVTKRECPGWRLAVFSGNPELVGELRLRSERRYKLFNGAIPAQLSLYELREENAVILQPRAELKANGAPLKSELSEGATMFANRLQKNQRRLTNWLKDASIHCYRLYDGDIPEYAVSIDVYRDALHVFEYEPPSSIDPQRARMRLSEVRQALEHLFPESRDRLYFKQRRRQRGEWQYSRNRGVAPGDSPEPGVFVVAEGPASFEVNLVDYLDCGLFLDHRPVRELIGNMAEGKHFLNLFCYTGTASVRAAIGGARESLSLDISNVYLDWARRNYQLNNIDMTRHQLQRADCLAWLKQQKEGGNKRRLYQLIFCDPPTFSNSKKMAGVLDIQRDHPALIRQVMKLLAPDGTLVFSNNFRHFRMDESLRKLFRIESIGPDTIDPDFRRNPKIHNCWLITHL